MLKSILANAYWLMVERGISLAINVITAILLARFLGAEGFGTISYLLAMLSLATPFATLGLGAIVSKEIINKPERESTILFTSVAFRLVAGVIVASSAIWLMTHFEDGEQGERLGLVLIFISVIFSSLHVFEFWFHANMAAKRLSIVRLLVILSFFTVKLSVLVFGGHFQIPLLALAYSLENLAFGLAYLLVYRRSHIGKLQYTVDIGYGATLVKKSSWLIFSGIFAMIYFKVDQVMLKHMTTDRDVGIYSAAVKIAEVCYYAGDAIIISVFPLLLKYREQSLQLYHEKIQLVADGLTVLGAAVVITVLASGWYIIPAVLGEEYRESVVILNVHIFSCLLMYYRLLASKWMIAEDFLSLSLLSHGLGAVINVCLNVYLIPEYRGLGAAVATIISYAISCYFVFWMPKRSRGFARILTKALLLPINFTYRYLPGYLIRLSKYGAKDE